MGFNDVKAGSGLSFSGTFSKVYGLGRAQAWFCRGQKGSGQVSLSSEDPFPGFTDWL